MIHWGHKFYWFFPAFAAFMWLGMLLGMLLYWIIDTNSVVYQYDDDGQTIAYISDVGASKLQPLFIVGSIITVVFLDIGLLAERWLRHEGRLAPNTGWFQKAMSICSFLAAVAGALGLILLSIYDVKDYKTRHDTCLGVFIIGYVLSAIFICTEYQRLGMKYREHFMLRFSFWYKLLFILVEIGLAIAFGVLNETNHINAAAIVEWVVSLIFTGYVFSFAIDLIPAIRNHHMQSHYTNGHRKSLEAGESPVGDMNAQSNGAYGESYNSGYRGSGYRTPPAHF